VSVRGYADWNPKPEALYWVHRTRQVLDAYSDYLPLSVRQIFYRLVAEHDYEKTEAGYGRLTGILSRARRAGLLPWEAIRDGGLGRTVEANYFANGDHFERSVRKWAEELHLDRQRDQAQVIELWCEAGGMVPILEGIADPYSCQVSTGGGYDSVTAKHNLAERAGERAAKGLKTVVLHVGDFDASGEDMCEVLREDAGLMVVPQVLTQARKARGGKDPSWVPEHVWPDLDARTPKGDLRVFRWAISHLEVERVALTAEQVVERRPETAPPKRTDSRTAAFVERNEWVADELGTDNITVQLEALTPPELTELISGAIEEHLDMDAYAEVLDEEQQVRTDLLERLDRD
jgi:hypothetical protein